MRVEKIFMPSRDEVIFALRGAAKRRLLINASTNAPRLSLTDAQTENPAVPPTFCMVLRKHFSGAKLKRVYMPSFERCAVIDFECKNDFFEPVEKSIVVELMGRSANMILLENDRIIDAIRRVDLTGGRTVLPSAKYEKIPPQSDKQPFTELCDVRQLLCEPELTLDKAIMKRLSGISPLNAREIAYLSCGVSGRLCKELSQTDIIRLEQTVKRIQDDIKNGSCAPCVIREAQSGKSVDFSFMQIRQYGAYCEIINKATPSAAIERYFGDSTKKMRLDQKTRDLSQLLTRLTSRISKTTAVRKKELENAANADIYRIYGELINANLYRMSTGMRTLEAQNYYDECKTVKIPLNPALSPSQNAQAYFKKYTKAKNSAAVLKRLISRDSEELKYLESVFLSLCDCENAAQAEEIRAELVSGGYIRRSAKMRINEKPSAPRTLEYEGYTVLVGRNNLQNDALTVRLSRRGDIWLHTKSVHSSHVLIQCRGTQPPDSVIEFAAGVCAFYSKAKHDKKVDVDYCPVQNVKKPSGAKPGMVVYDNYNTVTVEPREV